MIIVSIDCVGVRRSRYHGRVAELARAEHSQPGAVAIHAVLAEPASTRIIYDALPLKIHSRWRHGCPDRRGVNSEGRYGVSRTQVHPGDRVARRRTPGADARQPGCKRRVGKPAAVSCAQVDEESPGVHGYSEHHAVLASDSGK